MMDYGQIIKKAIEDVKNKLGKIPEDTVIFKVLFPLWMDADIVGESLEIMQKEMEKVIYKSVLIPIYSNDQNLIIGDISVVTCKSTDVQLEELKYDFGSMIDIIDRLTKRVESLESSRAQDQFYPTTAPYRHYKRINGDLVEISLEEALKEVEDYIDEGKPLLQGEDVFLKLNNEYKGEK